MSFRKPIRLILLVVSLLPTVFSVRAQSQLHFDEEYLTFELHRQEFRVSGVYLFSSTDSSEHTILYPFPVDTLFGEAYDIQVRDVKSGKNLPIEMEKDKSGIRFQILVAGSVQLQIGYAQALKSNRAKYILTTTQNWGRPLHVANYTLVVDANLEMLKFPMMYQKKMLQGSKILYFWQKTDFMPTTDFEVQFK